MSLYGSVFAAVYDPFLALGERAGMGELRRDVLADARGDVLEIGAGTGLNLEAYPAAVTALTQTEPEPAMAARLRRAGAAHRLRPTVVEAGAESLPFPDGSFDTVVSTLVLCTVEDVERSLAELRRVLRPDGDLLVIEHVRADGARLAGWQDRLHRPWRAFGCGCHCNRDTAHALTHAGFTTDRLRDARWHRMPPIVAPLIAGPAARQS